MANYGYRVDGSELKTQWETILYYLQTTPEPALHRGLR